MSVNKNNDVCLAGMVYIPEGRFTMGSDDGFKNEQPQQQPFVSAFCIDQTEFTNASAERLVSEFADKLKTKRGFAEGVANALQKPMKGAEGPNKPMTHVTWHQAKALCEVQGKRLPTEAEWEKAARGPQENVYATKSGGLTRDEANFDSHFIADVGRYAPNDYGVFDMTGNVSEWTNDWYKSAAYRYMSPKDPSGPHRGWRKVVRGGSWFHSSPAHLRTTNRGTQFKSDIGAVSIGFRCVAAPE
ncbi:MAG: SUMF1/EgtB/PvdO family nonheme iron enzyme [Deltaproteobacteria bacterium]|nr:SUMF1/EgtB/PvdO family nonheme iron enzyme [Deltaproteobacteria bacterium]